MNTNETPTPETDAEWRKPMSSDARGKRMFHHARKMERERDDARKLLEAESRDAVKIAENLLEMELERDEYRHQMEKYAAEAKAAIEAHEVAYRERDKALIRAENAEQDRVQSDVDSLRAFHERNELREQLTAERALADRLVAALDATRWDSPVACRSALTAWKEARK